MLGTWRRLGLAGASLSLIALAGCGSASTSARSGTVDVVAAENFWGDITAQIAGSHARVTSIISDPNADPHSYETDPKDAAAMSSAQLVILNGAGYDDFANKLLSASPNKSRTVITVATAAGVTGDNPNPHLWYSPVYVKDAAAAVTTALERLDPSSTSDFQANEAAFLAAYQPYLETVATIRSKYAGDEIAYTERVPGYLVDAAGLKLGIPASFAQSIEDGNEPSPSDTAIVDAAMKNRSVKVLLYNAQVTSPVTEKVKALATAADIPIVGVSETIPLHAKDFQTWQISQAKALLSALGG